MFGPGVTSGVGPRGPAGLKPDAKLKRLGPGVSAVFDPIGTEPQDFPGVGPEMDPYGVVPGVGPGVDPRVGPEIWVDVSPGVGSGVGPGVAKRPGVGLGVGSMSKSRNCGPTVPSAA